MDTNKYTSDRKSMIERSTKETQITATLTIPGNSIVIDTPVPFFNHMLNAMFFHGGFGLDLKALGDVDVEPHHLVEDTGLVLGDAVKEIFNSNKNISRFSQFVIPMDEAIAEAVIDISGRPYLVFQTTFPQARCGDFDMSLVKEFFYAFCSRAGITMHLNCRYGDNSHHMAEAMFKAAGKALGAALQPTMAKTPLSTKGAL